MAGSVHQPRLPRSWCCPQRCVSRCGGDHRLGRDLEAFVLREGLLAFWLWVSAPEPPSKSSWADLHAHRLAQPELELRELRAGQIRWRVAASTLRPRASSTSNKAARSPS